MRLVRLLPMECTVKYTPGLEVILQELNLSISSFLIIYCNVLYKTDGVNCVVHCIVLYKTDGVQCSLHFSTLHCTG